MADKNPPQLRLRVFAGPNGSGKSTVIKEIRETEVRENRKLDVGIYINADDIAQKLKSGKFTFAPYDVKGTHTELVDFAKSQGLLYGGITETDFSGSFRIEDKKLVLDNHSNLDRVAQVIARFLRHALIAAKKRFSFEKVFSHDSNLADMRLAAENGREAFSLEMNLEHYIDDLMNAYLQKKELDRFNKRMERLWIGEYGILGYSFYNFGLFYIFCKSLGPSTCGTDHQRCSHQ